MTRDGRRADFGGTTVTTRRKRDGRTTTTMRRASGKILRNAKPTILQQALQRYANFKCEKWDQPREAQAGRAVKVRAVSQCGQLSRPRRANPVQALHQLREANHLPDERPITNPTCGFKCAVATAKPAPTPGGEAAREVSGEADRT